MAGKARAALGAETIEAFADRGSGSCGVQPFDQDFVDKFDFDVLDPTNIMPEGTTLAHRK